MSNFKNSKIIGLISYLNENGQRVSVPQGNCEFSDNNGFGPFLLRWEINGEVKQIQLSDIEYSQYLATGQFKIIG